MNGCTSDVFTWQMIKITAVSITTYTIKLHFDRYATNRLSHLSGIQCEMNPKAISANTHAYPVMHCKNTSGWNFVNIWLSISTEPCNCALRNTMNERSTNKNVESTPKKRLQPRLC